ncbi:MAG: HEPN domain-containing protein [Terriglobales bacterium]
MAETRREFQQLARMRLKDARVLMQRGNVEGAYYLTGLAVECAVKACIARNTNRHDFPPSPNAVKDIYTHDLVKLVGAAKLQALLDAEIRVNSSLNKNWAVVKDWNINSRYLTKGLNARDLYRAVAGRDGVMQWLRQRW